MADPEPLELLSYGVDQISRGNLDYRLEYSKDDEFLPVCTAFNGMAERLERSVELARRNEENRKELLLDISHDLRSPLTSIRAYVEGLSDGVASTPEMQKRYLDTIKRKTEDIEKMVSALFAYSKLNMEEFEINMDRYYSLVFHGIIGIVIAATAVIIPFGSFASGIKSCAADIICLAVGIAAALLLDRFNRKFDKD